MRATCDSSELCGLTSLTRTIKKPGPRYLLKTRVKALGHKSLTVYHSVQSLIDDVDDVEAEFSMLKCSMIEDGTYFEEPRTETSNC